MSYNNNNNNNYFLTSKITGLTNGVIQELNNPNKHTIKDYEEVLRNPWARACVQLKALRATISIGDYQNENKEIQEFINDNIENMDGSLPDIVGRLCSAMPFGHSCAEIGFKVKKSFRNKKYTLQGINILDPKRIRYAGHYGNITHVKYYDGIRDVWVPYEKCLHVTNGLITNYNERTAYGDPECEVAYPFIKLYSVILSEMAVSAKTLATGILVGLADSDNTVYLYDKYNQPLKDSSGKPISVNAVQHLAEQLKGLENHSHIVTDKKNTVTALQIPAGENFWNLSLQLLKNDIMAAFITPSMVFSEGSGAMGVASLSARHLSILDATVEAIVKQIRDQLIEKVIRPLIVWNFGEQKKYGEFVVTSVSDPNQESLLINNLVTAFAQGLVPQTDVVALNVLREKLKLPPIDIAEQERMQMLQMQMQQNMQAPVDPSAEEQMPEEQQSYM
jgi:hypothetical protein